MSTMDLHVHTTFCDGASSPRALVMAAVEKGMDMLGFSAHAHTAFDESYCMLRGVEAVYQKEIRALSREFAGKIRILCGIEQDFFSDTPTDAYDYVIGSVHYVLKDGQYYSVDTSAEGFSRMLREGYAGDAYAAAEDYYREVSEMAEKMRPTFIGHFDLFTKFNEKYAFFDEQHPRYRAAWQAALDKILPLGIPFEVNTGAIARGYKTVPYPSHEQLLYIQEGGGQVLLSGDTHSCDALCFGFAEWEKALSALSLVPLVR